VTATTMTSQDQILAWGLAAKFPPAGTGFAIVMLCLGAALAQKIVKGRAGVRPRVST